MGDIDFQNWTMATANVPYGVQQVLHSSLELVAEEKLTMTYGADFGSDGSPCLINSAGKMLKATGGQTGYSLPSVHFHDVVRAFDDINRELYNRNVNTDNHLSPLAAEILLANFAPLKDKPIEAAVDEATHVEAFANASYREPSDEDMAREWLTALTTEAPTESEPNSGGISLDKAESVTADVVNEQHAN